MAVEASSINIMDVVVVAKELNLLKINTDQLENEFGSKFWVSYVVRLFSEQINFDKSLSLKEYFS